jgi:FG-GAP repeat
MRSILLALLVLAFGADHALAQARGAIPHGTGDVNGDSVSDVLLRDRVVFGTQGAGTLLARANGFAIVGEHVTAWTIAGDVNGDGLDDIVIGTSTDRAYVVFGKRDTAPVQLENLGPAGIEIDGPVANVALSAVTGVGDLDDDGRDDVLIGAPRLPNPHARGVGGAFLVRGRPDAGIVDLAEGPNVAYSGYAADDRAGTYVAGPGDVNGDGIPDLLIGAHRPVLVYGARGLRSLVPARRFVRMRGPIRRVAPAGDVDADGFEDFVLGREVVLGAKRGRPRTLPVPDAAIGGGDINGDGLGDLVANSVGLVRVANGSHSRKDPDFKVIARAVSIRPVGDVDGDLRDDVLVTASTGQQLVLRGAGGVLEFS